MQKPYIYRTVYGNYMAKKNLKGIRTDIVLSKEMIEGIDRAVELGYAMNRSDFIRAAIGRQLQELSIIQEMKKRKSKE